MAVPAQHRWGGWGLLLGDGPGTLAVDVADEPSYNIRGVGEEHSHCSTDGWMKESETVGESCAKSSEESVWKYYEQMVPNNVAFVKEAKGAGRPIVGIYCEFTPRELILAAGGVPVCLCGTSEKTIPAAEVDLPTNLCPLIKSSYGFVVEGTCPYYEMADAVIAETTCDGKKKMFELIAQRRPTHILELTQKVDEAAAYDHWYREVVGMKEFLECTLSVAVTDEALRAAIGEMNEWRRLLNGLYDYTRCHPPVIRGTQMVRTREHALGNPKAYQMLHRLAEVLEAKKDRGEYVAGPDAPRIMVTGCPTGVGVEKVIRITEELGAAVVCQESCTGIKPIRELVEEDGDPLAAIARKYLHLPCSCMTPNQRRLDLIRELTAEFDVAGVVDLVWTACHTYNVESHVVRRLVTDDVGLPYLKIETDYSPSDREQLATRIEAFLELVSQ